MALREEEREKESEWPYGSLLLFGFFGADTPGGRRLRRHTTAALTLIVIAIVALVEELWPLVPRAVWVVALPSGIGWIGWAYGRYLAALDELGREIQLKAFAFSYGAAMTVAAGLLGWALTDPEGVRPGAMLPWLVVAELLRGLALVVLARRYR